MAKLIFTSRYIRDAPPEHLQNYVRYISTREGVEKADESKKDLPATSVQKDQIRQLLKDMPESRDMLEYEDYHQRPTIGNASEFITQALERKPGHGSHERKLCGLLCCWEGIGKFGRAVEPEEGGREGPEKGTDTGMTQTFGQRHHIALGNKSNIINSTFPPIKLVQMLELSSKKCNKLLY